MAGCVELEDERRDVPGVVLTAVVPTLKREPGDLQGCRHSWALAQAMCVGEHRLDIDVARCERILGVRGLALAPELVTVVVAPACPWPGPSLVLGGERPAGGGEADPGVDLGLGQAGQFGGERADGRTLGPDHDAVSSDALAGAQIDSGETDLDDLADLARRRPIFPACRLDIDHVKREDPKPSDRCQRTTSGRWFSLCCGDRRRCRMDDRRGQ